MRYHLCHISISKKDIYIKLFLFGGATQNRTGGKGVADLCLTAWLWRRITALKAVSFGWSGLRGSNPLPPPWQGGALPNELNPHICALSSVTEEEELAIRMGLEPTTSAVTGRHSNQLNYRTVWLASARLIIIAYLFPKCNTFLKKISFFLFFYCLLFRVRNQQPFYLIIYCFRYIYRE